MSPEIRDLVVNRRVNEIDHLLGAHQLVRLIGILRRSPGEESFLEVADQLSDLLLNREPTNRVVITVRAAVLKDIGNLHASAALLAQHLNERSDPHFLRVAGSVLWRMNQRQHALNIFHLADSISNNSGVPRNLTTEEVRYAQTNLRNIGSLRDVRGHRRPSSRTLVHPQIVHLEEPIAITGLDGFTIRPLKSKRQLARVANQLHNCLNSYLDRVLEVSTLLFAVEQSGRPVEVIEVDPASRFLRQWKGAGNVPADPHTQALIRDFLSNPWS